MSTSKSGYRPILPALSRGSVLIIAACLLSSCALFDASQDPSDASDASHVDSGQNSQADTDSHADIGVDAGTPPDERGDADGAGEELGALAGCQGFELDQAFRLDSSGEVPQIQPRAAFDGSAVWVVYARKAPEHDNMRDIYAARVACNGQIGVERIKVSTQPALVPTPTPSIDIKGDTVHIVWETKPSAGSSGYAIAYRTFELNGRPKMDEPVRVAFNIEADALVDSGAMSYGDVVALSDGDAVIAATARKGHALQIILQKIDDQGTSKGPAKLANPLEDVYQMQPSITVDPNDLIWLSWLQIDDDGVSSGAYYTYYGSFDSASFDSVSEVKRLSSTLSSQKVGPQLVKSVMEPDNIYLVSQQLDLKVRLANVAQSSDLSVVGFNTNTNTHPVVVASENGGLVAWNYQRNGDEAVRRVYIQSFRSGADRIQLDDATVIVDNLSPYLSDVPGHPAVVSIGGGYYFVVSQFGDSLSNTEVEGRFLQL